MANIKMHTSAQDYNEANSDAARFARKKYEGMISQGRTNMRSLLERIDALVPDDALIRAPAMKFEPDDQRGLILDVDGEGYTIHKHALGHMGQRSGIKSLTPVLRDLMAPQEVSKGEFKVIPWRTELAAKALNEAYAHQPEGRYLSRSIDRDIRGFLSDRYRRYDVRPILQAFIQAIQGFGAVPLDGFATDTKISCRVVLPYLLEPIDQEVMLYGLEIRNSDFGDGKLLVQSFIDRVWCTNLCTMQDVLSKVHLGSKLPDNIEFSQETYELDTQTMASAMGDVVKGVLAPGKVNATMAMVKQSAEDSKDWRDFGRLIRTLTKGEAEKVKDAFEKGDDVTYLPKGKSTWRMSNALSWLATQTEDRDRRMDLESLAGDILPKVA